MAKTTEETVATGRRKRAVSSVRMRPGTGKIDVTVVILKFIFLWMFKERLSWRLSL